MLVSQRLRSVLVGALLGALGCAESDAGNQGAGDATVDAPEVLALDALKSEGIDAPPSADTLDAPDAVDVADSSDAPRVCAMTEVCGNGLDDTCDGIVDERCPCLPGMTQMCYPGPRESAGVGACAFGTQRCEGTGEFGLWSACGGATIPGGELCDGVDNDCDGRADNGCECRSGDMRACYGGPAGTRDVGLCRSGSQLCFPGPGGVGSRWGDCAGETRPAMEVCDGLDNDCNGTPDECCGCMMGATRRCYAGAARTEGVGRCRAGTQTCAGACTAGMTSAWGTCVDQVLPDPEVCDGVDNNCDGVIDDGCACAAGETRSCYDGPMGTRGVGGCAAGTQACVVAPGGVGSAWGACVGQRLPSAETCDDADNNCNGAIDESCVCRSSETRNCYSGRMGSAGLGICRAGMQRCVVESGVARWGVCAGEVLPAAETCDSADNDCDGMVDNGCACRAGESRSCYSGPTLTAGRGACRAGTQACAVASGVAAWGACVGEALPRPELCDSVDNDCDGVIDNGCACRAGATQACYSGASGPSGVGICRSGSQACVSGAGGVGSAWGACTGEVVPRAERCNSADDNCNGAVDDGAGCSAPTVTCPAPVTAPAGSTVTLRATATATGAATYQWQVISAPPGSSYTLGSPTSTSTTFTSVIVGTFTLRFTVTDAMGRTASCMTTVTMQGHGLRVELSWDSGTIAPDTSNRVDLDLHMHNRTAPSWFNDPDDCFYANRAPRWDVRGSTLDDPNLDIDNLYGFGPENIRVDSPVVTSQTYSVGVHYYFGAPRAAATVRIYCGDVLSATFTHALNGGAALGANNDFWRVARVTFTSVSACTVTRVDDIVTFTQSRTGSL